MVVLVSASIHFRLALFSNAELFEDVLHQAPFGEGGLQEIGPDEGGEPQQIGRVEMGQERDASTIVPAWRGLN